MRLIPLGCVVLTALAIAKVAPARADVVQFGAGKDNTLYQDLTGQTSNGAGDGFFVGRTNQGSIRRGLVAFDVSTIPTGSTINTVTLRLNLIRTTASSNATIQVRRLLADWGEAGSDAGSTGGAGTQAQPGDATWLHRFYDTTLWTTAGGVFAASSGSTSVGGLGGEGFYNWSTAGLRNDVQGWVNGTLSNFGWLLRDAEASIHTARKFASRENPDAMIRPALIVDFTPIPEPAAVVLLAAGAVFWRRR